MSMLQPSDKALTDILVKHQYKYKDQTKRDVSTALSYFKDLSIKPDHHVYPNGLMKDLVSLYGTIPVNFRNNTYNIPVQLFLSENHPYEPPLVYVRPTPDMSINVSEQVDSNGRVNMPALRDWHYPKSDLYMLLNMMSINFSQATPLYSKSASNRPQSSVVATPTAQNNVNPPYPVNGSNIPMPPFPVDSFMRPSYPLPGMIPTNNQPAGPAPPPSGAYPTQTPYPPNPYYPQPLSHIKNSNSNSNMFGQTRPTQPYPSSVNVGPPLTNPARPMYSDDTIKPEHFRMSLISAVQDKIRMKFKDACEAKRGEVDSLKRINNDLEMSQRNLTYLITDAENECMNIEELTAELKRKSVQLNEHINRQQLRGKADIEDAVVTPAPLYRQLLHLFAEEMAIQDLIFYLGEGLSHQTITLDNFLKQVRLLTRKQFVLRATMQMAREKAGLAN